MNSAHIVVPTTPVLLINGGHTNRGLSVAIRVISGTIYLGGINVSTSDGFIFTDADGIMAANELVGGDSLYAVSAGSVTIHVLRSEVD